MTGGTYTYNYPALLKEYREVLVNGANYSPSIENKPLLQHEITDLIEFTKEKNGGPCESGPPSVFVVETGESRTPRPMKIARNLLQDYPVFYLIRSSSTGQVQPDQPIFLSPPLSA
jgi:hypothetical protein